MSDRASKIAQLEFSDALPVVKHFPIGFALKQIAARRELLFLLVRREIKSRYKDSALGMIWSLVRPIINLLIYYVAIGHFLGAIRAIPNFAIYVFSGLTAWQLFSEIVSSGTNSLVANSGILKKVYLPREIFPLAATGAALFNYGMQLVILVAGTLLLSGFPWGAQMLYFLPATALILVWGIGLALLLSAANVYLRDIQYLVEMVLMVGFWASPIVYSWSMVAARVSGFIQELYLANPMTLVILGYQKTFWINATPDLFPPYLSYRMLLALAVGVVFFMFAQSVFARAQRNIAQEL